MNNFNDLFLEANNYYKAGVYDLVISKLDEAEQVYSKADNNKFSLEDLCIFRGGAYFMLQEYERARINFENALKLNPNSCEACLGLGQYFRAKGQFENAKAMFEWAVNYKNEHAGARTALENINVKLAFPPNHNTLSIINNPVKPSQKLGPLDEAAQLFSEKKYRETLSKLFSAKKEQEEILGSIENFIAFNYLELDNTDGAKNAAERALRVNPFSSQAYATLGEIYFREKEFSAAKKMYEISLRHNAENNFAKSGLQNTNNALGLPGGNGKLIDHNLVNY
jgi:Tfp pilus assembly protein PilF